MSLKSSLILGVAVTAGCGVALLTFTGCVAEPGYPGDPGYYDDGPEVGFFGDYGWGHDRDAGHRGYQSRGGHDGGHGGGHAGGGGGGSHGGGGGGGHGGGGGGHGR